MAGEILSGKPSGKDNVSALLNVYREYVLHIQHELAEQLELIATQGLH